MKAFFLDETITFYSKICIFVKMKNMKYLILALSLLAIYPVQAQKKKAKVQVVKVEKSAGEKLFETMVSGTAKVMFIDSTIVDKSDFLKNIPLSKDAGDLTANATQAVYTNALGNRRIYSEGDTLKGIHLYSSDLLGDTWSKPRQLSELDAEMKELNYPFLLADGITLFFAGKGEKSMGGYDIFMTRLNTDDGTYYKPENYGLPFNSTANDYLLVIDDIDSLGWLVSDRYQPADKVCIYTFEPTNPRLNFGGDNLTNQQIESYAKLNSIQATWGFGNRKAALERLANLRKQNHEDPSQQLFAFPINDRLVYSSLDDFKSEKTRTLFKQLTELKNQLKVNEQTLEGMRTKYSSASVTEKKTLQNDLLNAEKTIQQQRTDVRDFEKKIRNEENQLLTHS